MKSLRASTPGLIVLALLVLARDTVSSRGKSQLGQKTVLDAIAQINGLSKLSSKDVEVVGVSGDTVKTHAAFKKAHNLNFALLADGDGKVAEKFGVPCALGEKTAKGTVDGKEEAFVRTATISRWTFVIDKKGKIASKNSTVKAAEDSKAILELIETLK